MGWKSLLRSVAAQERDIGHDSEQILKAVRYANKRLDQVTDAANEAFRHSIQTANLIEEKFRALPLSETGVTYKHGADSWQFKKLRYNKGDLEWTADFIVGSHPATSNELVRAAARIFRFVAVASTPWAFYAAFEATPIKGQRTPSKLFTKTNPSSNKVFLFYNGERHRAIEGDLDLPLFDEPDVLLAAFPPITSCTDISFGFALDASNQKLRVTLSSPLSTPKESFVEIVRRELQQQMDIVHELVASQKTDIQNDAEARLNLIAAQQVEISQIVQKHVVLLEEQTAAINARSQKDQSGCMGALVLVLVLFLAAFESIRSL